MLFNNFLQFFATDVGVYFGCGYVLVSEHFFYAQEVCAVIQNVGCERMTQHMGRNF
jgi:hypothetical protein